MKRIIPWVCLAAISNTAMASNTEGLWAYRLGHYSEAVQEFAKTGQADPVVNYYLGRMRLYGYGQLKNDILAVRHFKQAANKGFLPAIQTVASYSLLMEKNPEEALIWFKKAADANDVSAQMYCAAAYLYGLGVKKNPDIAKKYFIAAAKNGQSIAQTALAASFFETRQMANKKLGLIWLEKAVAQKNPEAQMMMGELYLRGDLMPADVAKAKEYLGLAIAQNYAPAMSSRAKIAISENQWEEAKNWLVKASQANDESANIALSAFYANDKNPLHDPHTSFLWMLKAAQNGSIDAQRSVASMYKNGLGTTQDEGLAQIWEKKAAETSKNAATIAAKRVVNWLTLGKATTFSETPYRLQGIFSAWQNPSVLKENNYNQPPQMEHIVRQELYKPHFVMTQPNQIPLSEYYHALVASFKDLKQDKLVFPQYPVAMQADSKATKEGETHAQSAALPAGKPQDEASLVKALEGRAILGDSTAQFEMAQRYQNGLGVTKDIQAAAKFYAMAAKQDDLRAQYNLGVLYLQGDGIPADYRVGMNLLNEAAFKGNTYAQYVIARIYEQGYHDAHGVEAIKPQPEQAIPMYHLAAANDYGPAEYRLAEILVREDQTNLTQIEKKKRNELVKTLYEGAVKYGVKEAKIPRAFYNAMDKDPQKQAEAVAAAREAATQGDAQAALLLALLYDRGVTVKADPTEALKWYQKASVNPVSSFILGTYYSQGLGVHRDLEKGRELLQKSAAANFAYAHLNLAVLQQQNHEVFLPALKQALALGNSSAGLLLADYYLSREKDKDGDPGDEETLSQAHKIYQNFAEKGIKSAQLKLGFLYEHGIGGHQDLTQAEQWYRAAAQQGQPVAQFLLGRLYQIGFANQQPDYQEAKKWYAAAQSKYAPAAVARGFLYDTVDDNYQQAFEDYQLAASQGDPIGQFNLGLIYEKGKGRPVDFTKAREFYVQAAAKGHSQAMVQLGGLYLNGLLGSRDEKQAIEWYRKAADLKERDALYQLGFLSETGVIDKVDYPAAFRYYQQAADQGHAKATLALARMYQYGLGIPKDTQQAARLYKQLSAMNNPYAQYQLARFYYEGTAGEHLPQRAKELMLEAEANGSTEAHQALEKLNVQVQRKERMS